MLVQCPSCEEDLEASQLRPRSLTAECPRHGEVTPHVRRPALGEARASEDWSAMWSSPTAATYRYEVAFHAPMKARCPALSFEWGAGASATFPETVFGLVFAAAAAVVVFPLTRVPRLFAPTLTVDRDRVRFGRRSREIAPGDQFIACEDGMLDSFLALKEEVGEPIRLIECGVRARDLRPVCDALNEALFVVRQAPAPVLAQGAPYRS